MIGECQLGWRGLPAVLAYHPGPDCLGRVCARHRLGRGVRQSLAALQRRIVPRAPALATVIEFSHRLTSGLSLLAIAALVVWIFRAWRAVIGPAGGGLSGVADRDEARLAPGWCSSSWWPTSDDGRAMFVAVHLLNTFYCSAP